MPDEDGYFGERVAASYDESSAEMFDPAVVDPIVDLLVELAGERTALELGIGTGRIALPLARRGVPCTGSSSRRPWQRGCGRSRAAATSASRSATSPRRGWTGRSRVAYLVFNTIMNLTTQAAQVACFKNVAAHLEPGGCFVIETAVTELQRLPPGETVRAFHVSETKWGFDEYDVANQG